MVGPQEPGKQELVNHIHCDNCHLPILEGEQTGTATKLRPVGTPQGIAMHEIAVPVCQGCYQKIVAEKTLPPRIIVPKHNGG